MCVGLARRLLAGSSRGAMRMEVALPSLAPCGSAPNDMCINASMCIKRSEGSIFLSQSGSDDHTVQIWIGGREWVGRAIPGDPQTTPTHPPFFPSRAANGKTEVVVDEGVNTVRVSHHAAV